MSDTTTETAAVETSDDSTAESTSTETTETATAEAALGDAGKKALDAMKADRNKAREDAKKLREEFEAFKAKSEGKEAEYAAAQQKRETEQAALAKANDRIRRSEVKAAAKGVLADPADAYKFLDLDSFEVGDDGEVDEGAIASALADLIKEKPYLAVQDSKRFQGDADAGTRKETRPAQLTKSDLDRMSPEQIVKAKQGGQFDDLLGIKR